MGVNGTEHPGKYSRNGKAFYCIAVTILLMAVVTEGKLGAVIVFSLLAGIAIGLFVGYMLWVLRIFGCIISVRC